MVVTSPADLGTTAPLVRARSEFHYELQHRDKGEGTPKASDGAELCVVQHPQAIGQSFSVYYGDIPVSHCEIMPGDVV